MRKVRDYDSELKVLEERARALKARRVEQLGGLVVSTGADTLDLETLAGALLEAVASMDVNARRRGGRRALRSFSAGDASPVRAKPKALRERLAATGIAQRRNRALILRLEAARRRADTRGWVVQRRERTRHLIELGGLVKKAGLVDLTDDDRATIYGALLDLVGRARSDASGDVLMLWKRRGSRAFAAEADAAP